MMRIAVIAMALSLFAASLFAEVSVSGSAAVQVTKKAADYSTGNIDDSWARGEVKLKGSKESGLGGLVHLRTEPKLTGGTKGINLEPRQIYFTLPVTSTFSLMAGRWYEVYANGNYYFGRYLFGANKNVGTGSMNTNYSVVDGFKATAKIDAIKSALNIGILPGDVNFNRASLLAEFGGSPIEGLKFTVAGNFQVITPEDEDGINRASLNAGYTLMKEYNLNVFGEAAIVDFEEASDNAWFLIGVSSKIPMVLDRIQAEFEITNFRHGSTESSENLNWMVMMRKKVKDLTFDLNIGADQKSLGSQTPGEVGVILRTSASF